MVYQYEYDDTKKGDLTLAKDEYELVQEGYEQLKSILDDWNDKAIEYGADDLPYKNEVDDLDRIISWGVEELAKLNGKFGYIYVRGISVASLRYLKAALIYLIRIKEEEISTKRKLKWPPTVLKSLEPNLEKIKIISKSIDCLPSGFYYEIFPEDKNLDSQINWDLFISHASEDKEEIAKPLAELLIKQNFKVWYDELTLKLGDSLRRNIDKGLSCSKFGIVILSKAFFKKEWPQKELDGFVARENNGKKVILPLWHKITKEEVIHYSPMLADRLAMDTSKGLDKVVASIMDVLK